MTMRASAAVEEPHGDYARRVRFRLLPGVW